LSARARATSVQPCRVCLTPTRAMVGFSADFGRNAHEGMPKIGGYMTSALTRRNRESLTGPFAAEALKAQWPAGYRPDVAGVMCIAGIPSWSRTPIALIGRAVGIWMVLSDAGNCSYTCTPRQETLRIGSDHVEGARTKRGFRQRGVGARRCSLRATYSTELRCVWAKRSAT